MANIVSFRASEFVVASIVNIVVEFFKVTGWTIKILINRFAKEAGTVLADKYTEENKRFIQAGWDRATPQQRDTIEAVFPQPASPERIEEFLRLEMGSHKLFGRLVGVLEREIYIYALTRGEPGLISPVLLFKGFYAWIDIRSAAPAQEPAQPPVELGARILAKYYGYAIGNFVSLLAALFIFHAVNIAWTHIYLDLSPLLP